MHRSASTTRASDEFHLGMGMVAVATPPSGGGKGTSPPLLESLPRYDPQSDVARKEAARARSAEGVVHLIPLVLIACAVVLWLFSSPQIDVATGQGDSGVAIPRMENMTTIQGHSNDTNNSLPDLEDALAADQSMQSKTGAGEEEEQQMED